MRPRRVPGTRMQSRLSRLGVQPMRRRQQRSVSPRVEHRPVAGKRCSGSYRSPQRTVRFLTQWRKSYARIVGGYLCDPWFVCVDLTPTALASEPSAAVSLVPAPEQQLADSRAVDAARRHFARSAVDMQQRQLELLTRIETLTREVHQVTIQHDPP